MSKGLTGNSAANVEPKIVPYEKPQYISFSLPCALTILSMSCAVCSVLIFPNHSPALSPASLFATTARAHALSILCPDQTPKLKDNTATYVLGNLVLVVIGVGSFTQNVITLQFRGSLALGVTERGEAD